MLGMTKALALSNLCCAYIIYDHGYCSCHRIRGIQGEKSAAGIYKRAARKSEGQVDHDGMGFLLHSSTLHNRRCFNSGDINGWCDESRGDVLTFST